MRRAWWDSNMNRPRIPSGIIVPFMDVAANIPSGWAQFSYANDYLIKGALATGSGGVASLDFTSSYHPSHNTPPGAYSYPFALNAAGGSGSSQQYVQGQGGHSHDMVVTETPAKRSQVFMKASSERKYFPTNAGVLCDAALDLTLVDLDGYTLGITSANASTNVAQVETIGAPDTVGAHDHMVGTAAPAGSVVTCYGNNTAGDHTHSTSGDAVTALLQTYYMDLWTKSTGHFYLEEGMFALWESGTAPDGWTICDGTGGTPDLVDHFIGFDQAKTGTAEGDNTMNFATSLLSGGAHSHLGAAYSAYSLGVMAHTLGGAHTHTMDETLDWEPQHYTLVVIKYTG